MTQPANPGQLIWSWLHLSDIHFGHGSEEDRADQEDVIRQMVRDVSAVVAAGDIPRPQVLLVTGDIAYSGGVVRGAEEYDEATALIANLRNKIGHGTPVYAVPGNHDVQRTYRKSSQTAYRLISSLREGTYGDDSIDETFKDSIGESILNERFANYNKFCQAIGAPVAGTNGLWIERIPVAPGLNIYLIGINTALISNDDDDRGRLRVPYSTSTAAVRDISDDDIAFLMTHHPTNWLKRRDGQNLEMKIRRDVTLHLHGHVHDPETFGKVFGTGQSYMTVTAGAVHADPSETAVGVRNTYSFGALYRSDDETVRLRIWPRTWDGSRWHRDTAQTPEHADFVELIVPKADSNETVGLTTEQESYGEPLRSLALKSVRSVGSKRTAYPTDVSIEELYAADLVIPTPFGAKRARRDADRVSVRQVVATGLNGNVLLLGPPGAGKTVILYEFGQTFLTESDRVPIFVDITTFESPSPDVNEVSQTIGVDARELTNGGENLVFIVDGLDEALAAGVTPSDIGARLAALSTICQIVVSCRRDDYEFNLAAYVRNGLFAKIWYVHDWTLDQFHEFVSRLVAADLLLDDSLSRRVDDSPGLQSLVRRPLLARMLTFLADDQELPDEQTALYSDYMSKLGFVSDASANTAKCLNMPSARALWQRMSWLIFSNHLNPDSIQPRLIEQIARDAGIVPSCARRVLDGVLDLNATTGTYVHYSFFEFLTALHIATELEAKLPEESEAAAFLLARDLPIEIRHHLTRLLRQSNLDLRRWPQYLADAYRSCSDVDRTTALVIRNMIVYLACRLDVPADEPLLKLLEDEKETFLRNSLQWALTQHNNLEALKNYIVALNGDGLLSSYNRGYLLYYYGDLPSSLDPPHSDVEPFNSWDRTREALNEEYEADSYCNVAPTRKAIDLYTFCNIAGVRNDPLTEHEAKRFSDLIDELDGAGIPSEAMAILRAQLALVSVQSDSGNGAN